MFDNLKIGTKMILLSGIILALLTVTVIWAALGLSTAVDEGTQAAFGNKLSATAAHLELKHDAWNKKVNNFLYDHDSHNLQVKIDPKTCSLGKWYYGSKRQEAERLLPHTKAEFAALEEPHRLMHLSAKKIIAAYQAADPELPAKLYEIEMKHLIWAVKVQNSLLENSQQIKAHTDPETCALGKFLKTEQARNAIERSPEFAKLFKAIIKPHARLHNSVIRMNAALKANDKVARNEIYNYQLSPALSKVRSLLHAMRAEASKELEGLHKAQEIYTTETLPNLEKLKQHLKKIDKIASSEVISNQAMIDDALHARNSIIGIGISALLIGVIIAFLITKSLTSPMKKAINMLKDLENGRIDTRLNMKRRDEVGMMAQTMDSFADSLQTEIVDSLQKLAAGDLTFNISPRDDRDLLRGSLQKLGNDLNEIMLQIQTASSQIDTGSSQVSESAQDLSNGAARSAAAVEEISSSMTEIDSQIKTTAGNAVQANQLTVSASNAAKTGSDRMTEMISAMNEINTAGQDISKIIKVIDEIAFQTNLLALNAAVEAARAGQHGKGFAVVAEEVRNLAARSAKAAAATSELIEGSVEKSNKGTQIAESTAEALNEIVESVTNVADLIGEIADASKEQAEGISQVNIGIQQIDQSIQENTASSEESAATSEELASQAKELKHQLSRFRLKGNSWSQPEQLTLPPSNTINGSDSGWGEATTPPRIEM